MHPPSSCCHCPSFNNLHLYKNQQKEMRVSAQSKAAKAFVDAMSALEPDDVESSASDSQPISDGRRQDGKAKGGRRDTTEAKANPASRTRKATAKRRASADVGVVAVAEVSWEERRRGVCCFCFRRLAGCALTICCIQRRQPQVQPLSYPRFCFTPKGNTSWTPADAAAQACRARPEDAAHH